LDGETLTKPATKTVPDEHLAKQKGAKAKPKTKPGKEAKKAKSGRKVKAAASSEAR